MLLDNLIGLALVDAEPIPRDLGTIARDYCGIEGIDKVVIELGGSGAIDNLTFSHVPEPSTLLLSALGLAGLGAARRAHRARGG